MRHDTEKHIRAVTWRVLNPGNGGVCLSVDDTGDIVDCHTGGGRSVC